MKKKSLFFYLIIFSLSGCLSSIFSVANASTPVLFSKNSESFYLTNDSIDFKITTLNCEWLSCSTQNPLNDQLQVSNIASVISTMNSDIVALQEVGTSSKYATIDTIVKKLGSQWGGQIVPWDADNCSQNQGIVYKKAKVQYVNGSLITNGGSFYNWSSGRYPVLYNLNLIAGDTLIPLSVINIHAKASNDETSYSRRSGASTSLKALLDGSSYNTKNILLIGDYNDYLIGTQCSTCSPADSPYKNFMDDSQNYEGLTQNLHDPVYKSPVIDNMIISNELFRSYVNNSDFRETSATATIPNFSSTTTDHTPISALLRFKNKSTINALVSPINPGNGFSIYPNPVSDFLHIQSDNPVEKIELYSVIGNRLLLQQNNAEQINFSGLPTGMYLVKVYTNSSIFAGKIMKEIR